MWPWKACLSYLFFIVLQFYLQNLTIVEFQNSHFILETTVDILPQGPFSSCSEDLIISHDVHQEKVCPVAIQNVHVQMSMFFKWLKAPEQLLNLEASLFCQLRLVDFECWLAFMEQGFMVFQESSYTKSSLTAEVYSSANYSLKKWPWSEH